MTQQLSLLDWVPSASSPHRAGRGGSRLTEIAVAALRQRLARNRDVAGGAVLVFDYAAPDARVWAAPYATRETEHVAVLGPDGPCGLGVWVPTGAAQAFVRALLDAPEAAVDHLCAAVAADAGPDVYVLGIDAGGVFAGRAKDARVAATRGLEPADWDDLVESAVAIGRLFDTVKFKGRGSRGKTSVIRAASSLAVRCAVRAVLWHGPPALRDVFDGALDDAPADGTEGDLAWWDAWQQTNSTLAYVFERTDSEIHRHLIAQEQRVVRLAAWHFVRAAALELVAEAPR